jgi:hypothetical protein
MTLEERQLCIMAANEILATDLEKVAAQKYPNEDLQSVLVDSLELPWILTTLKRAAKQLVAELEAEAWRVLPNAVNVLETNLTEVRSGIVLLTKQVNYIARGLEDEIDFDNWLPETLFLVRYEMHYGFWDRAEAQVHSPDELALGKAQTETGLLIQQLNNGLTEASKAYKRLEEKTDSVNGFQLLKEKQFAELEENLEALKMSLSSVQDLEKQAAVSNGKISTLLDQSDKTLEASRKKIVQDRKAFDVLQSEIATVRQHTSDELTQLTGHRETFDALVVLAQDAKERILDQEARILELIGYAADGTLGGVFNNRKKELQWPVYLWIGLSITSVILALCWVVYVFQKTPSQDHNSVNWLILLANVVRTSPAFVLVYFCLAQYTKERNIQEEYAFKAAVSMTVTAYADMIGTGEVNERVKMLIDTIQRIYLPPILGKPIEPISFKSEHIAQAAKSMADTAQNLKSAATDLLKPSKPTSEV